MTSKEERFQAMEHLAGLLIDAGAALAVASNPETGLAVLVVADGVPRQVIINELRIMANSIERDMLNAIGQVSIKREEEDLS